MKCFNWKDIFLWDPKLNNNSPLFLLKPILNLFPDRETLSPTSSVLFLVTSVDMEPASPAGPCHSPVLKRDMSSTWVYVWEKLTFIVLLINVLRCYMREGASPSPQFGGPAKLGGFSAEQLRRMWAWAFLGLGRAARPRGGGSSITLSSRCRKHPEQRSCSTAGSRELTARGKAPGQPLLPFAASQRCPCLGGTFFAGRETTDPSVLRGYVLHWPRDHWPVAELGWLLSRHAEQPREDFGVPKLPSVPFITTITKATHPWVCSKTGPHRPFLKFLLCRNHGALTVDMAVVLKFSSEQIQWASIISTCFTFVHLLCVRQWEYNSEWGWPSKFGEGMSRMAWVIYSPIFSDALSLFSWLSPYAHRRQREIAITVG